jgi:hypothetical protein
LWEHGLQTKVRETFRETNKSLSMVTFMAPVCVA